MKEIATQNKNKLEELEGIIRSGIRSFYEVGRALIQIRNEELYKLKNGGAYETFEAYCKEEWDLSRPHAYRLMESATVMETLSPVGDILPSSERQSRALAKVEPEKQVEVWQKAVETAPNGKVTANHVEKVVKEFTTETKEVKTERQIEKTTKPKDEKAEKVMREKSPEGDVVDPIFQAGINMIFDAITHLNDIKWASMKVATARAQIQGIDFLLSTYKYE